MNFDIIKFHSQFCNTDMGTYYNSKYCDMEKIIMPEKNHLCNLDVQCICLQSCDSDSPFSCLERRSKTWFVQEIISF